MSDTSFSIDSLLEDLQSLNTSPTKSSTATYKSFSSGGSSTVSIGSGSAYSSGAGSLSRAPPSLTHPGSGESIAFGQESPVYLPHPPSTNKSPSMLNPKVKFAVLPDSSSNFHQKLNSNGGIAAGGDDLDHLLDMLDSPSMKPTLGTKTSGSSSGALSPKYTSAPLSPTLGARQPIAGTVWSSPSASMMQLVEDASSKHNHEKVPAIKRVSSWDSDRADSPQPSARPGSSSHATMSIQPKRLPSHNSFPTLLPAGAATEGAGQNEAMKLLEQKLATTSSSHSKTRCCRVVVAGSAFTRGLKASAFGKFACDALLCVHCNFKVLHFVNMAWKDVDYLFLRNNMPNAEKLKARLVSTEGSVAYCCQCTSLCEAKERALVQGVVTDPQWICMGH